MDEMIIDGIHYPYKGKCWDGNKILIAGKWYPVNDIVLEDSLDARTPDGNVFCICDNCRTHYKPLIPLIESKYPPFHRRNKMTEPV